MKSDFLIAVTQLAAERGLPRDKILAAVEAALLSAYRKAGIADGQDIAVRLSPGDGSVTVYVLKVVVDDVADEKREISGQDAQQYEPNAAIGDTVEIETYFPAAGRIAAQTAKQVVVQRLKEAERELIVGEYVSRVGGIVAGKIERMDGQQVVVTVGRAEAILPREEQVPADRYRAGAIMQFYLKDVANMGRGTEIILSRAHRSLVGKLFEREVPEIFKGIVEIRAIAREPGSRSKVAVMARQEGVDAVGSCVGLRGLRIQNIVNELQGEKIDVVQWHEDQQVFLANSLSPAQVLRVELDTTEGTAHIVVPDAQLSLAIGKEGQNARLAARLTGWKIEAKGLVETDSSADSVASERIDSTNAEEVAVVEANTVSETSNEQEISETLDIALPPATEPQSVPQDADSGESLLVEEPQLEPGSIFVETDPELTRAEKELMGIEAGPDIEEEAEMVDETPVHVLSVDDESLWVMPAQAEAPSALRFAEDLAPERGRARPTTRDRRGRTPEVPRQKAKKGKKARVSANPQPES